MADGVNQIITPSIPVERAAERVDKRDKKNRNHSWTGSAAARVNKNEPAPSPPEGGEKGKGGLVDIKA